MTRSVTSDLESDFVDARNEVKASARALDDAILTDPELSHKQRMVLIHLQSAARKQNLILELLAIHVDTLDKRIDNLVEHITS